MSEGFCITGSDDKFLRVWPVDFSDFFLEVEHDSPVTGVGISPNQLQVCIGTEKGSVGTMDIPSHKYVTLLRSHTDDIRQVAADPMHAEYTTVSLDGSIRVWSDATHKQLFEFDAKGQVPTCVMYHPKEYVFACGFESGIVRVYNIERTSLLQEHCQHKGAVTEVLFTPNGGLLLTAGSEGNICVYDVAQNYMPVKYLAASLPKKPIAMSISKDGKYLATSGAEPNSVLLFDAETLAPISKVKSPSGGLSKVMLSPNSNQLFVTTTDRKLECFEVPSGRFQYQMGTIHRTDCEAFDIHSSGQYAVTGGHDNLLKVWDCSPESVSSKRPGCQKFIAHSEGVSSVVVKRSSTKLISVGCSDTIYIWKWVGKPEGAEEPLSLEEAIVESALGMGDDDFAPGPPMPLPGVHWTETSPDEGLEANQVDPQCQTSIGFNGSAHSNVVWNAERGVFAYSNENSVVVEDLKTKKKEFLTLNMQSISTLALNKSGTLLASGSGAPEVERGMAPVYVWDLATNSCVQKLFYHKTGVQALTISDDDMWVVSVGCAPESFVVVWQADALRRGGALPVLGADAERGRLCRRLQRRYRQAVPDGHGPDLTGGPRARQPGLQLLFLSGRLPTPHCRCQRDCGHIRRREPGRRRVPARCSRGVCLAGAPPRRPRCMQRPEHRLRCLDRRPHRFRGGLGWGQPAPVGGVHAPRDGRLRGDCWSRPGCLRPRQALHGALPEPAEGLPLVLFQLRHKPGDPLRRAGGPRHLPGRVAARWAMPRCGGH